MASGEIRCPVNTCKQVISGGVDCLSTFICRRSGVEADQALDVVGSMFEKDWVIR